MKRVARKCRLCPNEIYETLDCHRIMPGEDGGEYIESNVVVVCSVCHRLIHAGLIKVDRWFNTMTGKRLLRIERGGQEEFI